MENRTILVDQKIKNIQSDFGSIDFETAKKFHNQLIPGMIQNAREFGMNDLPQNAEYENMLIARYNALYTELIADEIAMAEEVKTCFNQYREDYFNTNEGYVNYEITRIKQEFEKAKIFHGRPLGETDGSAFLMRRTWLVYLLLFIMGLLELPLNQSVFAPLSLGKAGTLMLSILLVSVVPILAHFCGKFIKQHKERTSNLVLGISVGLLLIALTLFLSVMRYLYFETQAIADEYVTFQEAYKSAQQNFKFGALFSSPIFWTSFLFNFGLVLVGFVLSYISHDSRDSFEKIYRLFAFRRPRLISQLSSERKKQHVHYKIHGNGAQTMEMTLLTKIAEFRRMHEALTTHVENLGVYVDGLCKEAINEFRLHNQAARNDLNTIPRHWKDEWFGFVAVQPKKIESIFIEVYSEMEQRG